MSGLLPLFFIVVVFTLNGHLLLTSASSYDCSSSSTTCPNGERIEYPYYLEDHNNEYFCGYPGLSAKCSGGRPILSLSNHSYYYQLTGDGSIRLMDIDTADQVCPKLKHNFSMEGAVDSSLRINYHGENVTYFYNCTTLPKDVEPNLPCLHSNNSFAMLASSIYLQGFNWYGNCQEKVMIPLSFDHPNQMNYTEVIKAGIWLWFQPNEDCEDCEETLGMCSYNKSSNGFRCVKNEDCHNCEISGGGCEGMLCSHSSKGKAIKLVAGVFTGIAGSLLILLLIYIRKCPKTSPTNEEVFLKNYGSHVLQRYKYSEVKKMTNSFKDILGQGGFGYVVKGKLPDGRMVAVKLLNESKGDGEEIINEVATIGRTNHVNVITLIWILPKGNEASTCL